MCDINVKLILILHILSFTGSKCNKLCTLCVLIQNPVPNSCLSLLCPLYKFINFFCITVHFPGHLISYSACTSVAYLSSFYTSSALCNVCTFKVTSLISLILFHYLAQFCAVWMFWRHILGFLTVGFLRWLVVSLLPHPQPGGPVHHLCNPQGRVAQLYPQAPGTHISYLRWDSLFPGHHTRSYLLHFL